MLAALLLLVKGPLLFAQQASRYVAGEALVCFDARCPGKAQRQKAVEDACGATVKHSFKLVPGLVSVSLPPGLSVEEGCAQLRRGRGIRFAQPNYLYQAMTVPNDPRFSEQWGLNNTGQSAGLVSGIDVRAVNAWNRSTGGTHVVVAVIDSGIDYTHEDLVANLWVNPKEIAGNGEDDDQNGYADDVHGIDVKNADGDPFDLDGHGTFCASILGAVGNNGIGMAGVSWNVRIMALKFLEGGYGSSAGAILCLQYAVKNGAKIVSGSFGNGTFDLLVKEAIEKAGQAGVLCVFPAGNGNGVDIDINPVYPASYDSTNIISVMSFGGSGLRSLHSNYGAQSVDIAAPGSAILGCLPGGGYGQAYGTSLAVPHVAGACALIYALNPELDWRQVKHILLDSAERSDAFTGLCVSGGRLNLSRSLLKVIPKAWLEQHGFNLEGSADQDDPDRDGMPNLDEWVAGTDPTNSLSRLRFQSSGTVEAGEGFLVKWQSVPGKTYWLASADALQPQAAFTPFVSNLVSTASQTEYRDLRPAATSRFYRVGVQME